MSARAIDCEGRGIIGVAMHGIKKALVGAKCEKRGIAELADNPDVGPCSRASIQAIDVNAIAARLALGGCEGSHIGRHRRALLLAGCDRLGFDHGGDRTRNAKDR